MKATHLKSVSPRLSRAPTLGSEPFLFCLRAFLRLGRGLRFSARSSAAARRSASRAALAPAAAAFFAARSAFNPLNVAPRVPSPGKVIRSFFSPCSSATRARSALRASSRFCASAARPFQQPLLPSAHAICFAAAISEPLRYLLGSETTGLFSAASRASFGLSLRFPLSFGQLHAPPPPSPS